MSKYSIHLGDFWESSIVRSIEKYISNHPLLSRFLGYWFLIYSLARRDIRARYSRSIIGMFWAILDPLFYLGIFAVLRIILGISSGSMPYLIFAFSALIPWTLFLSIANACPQSIISNASILKKISFPREVFLLVATVTALFDFFLSLLIMFLMMILFQVPFTWQLLWLPFLTGLLVLLSIGAGMWVAAYGVFRRDVIKISSYAYQMLFYFSPIFYPKEQVPSALRQLYFLNPFVGLLEGYRNILGAGQPPDLILILYALPIICIVFICGWLTFRKRSLYFADVL